MQVDTFGFCLVVVVFLTLPCAAFVSISRKSSRRFCIPFLILSCGLTFLSPSQRVQGMGWRRKEECDGILWCVCFFSRRIPAMMTTGFEWHALTTTTTTTQYDSAAAFVCCSVNTIRFVKIPKALLCHPILFFVLPAPHGCVVSSSTRRCTRPPHSRLTRNEIFLQGDCERKEKQVSVQVPEFWSPTAVVVWNVVNRERIGTALPKSTKWRYRTLESRIPFDRLRGDYYYCYYIVLLFEKKK